MFKITEKHGINKSELFKFQKRFLKLRRNWPFIECFSDFFLTGRLEDFLKTIKKHKFLVIIGLGGASLGTKAIFHALGDGSPAENRPLFLDNLDALLFKKTLENIDIKKTLFIVVSKSGETLETILIFKELLKRIRKPKNHFIVITENKNSVILNLAKKYNLAFFPHAAISGRFSVLTATSMLPSLLMGYDVRKFIEGASKADFNLAARLAAIQYVFFAKKNKRITVLFNYCEKLKGFCDWYNQLISESLGKKGFGPTLLTAVGPKDQHSLLQLFLEGPDDKWFIFLSSKSKGIFSDAVEKEKNTVQKMFRSLKKPFIEIHIKELNEKTLGNLFALFELQTALLAQFWGINAFTQEIVEKAKARLKLSLS